MVDLRYAVHDAPAWRERSNFIIKAALEENDSVDFEQLWARQVSEHQFEICCIPFHVPHLALGDTVETSRDGEYVFSGLISQSGRYVFRIWFGGALDSVREAILSDLEDRGVLSEWASKDLLALDAKDDNQAQELADYLWPRDKAGEIECEGFSFGN